MTHFVPYLAALLAFPLAGIQGAGAPALKPVTSDPFVTIHPICTAASHDSPNPTVLGCGLARVSDGAVLSVYSTPTGYYSKPGTTWIAGRVTKDGGKTWSPESVIARHPNCQPSHPSVLTTRDGVIHVFYLGFKKWEWKDGNPTDETQSDMWTTRSSDNGATWSKPQMIFKGYTGASNGAIETRDGHLVVPYSHYVNNPGRLVLKRQCPPMAVTRGASAKMSTSVVWAIMKARWSPA